MFFPVALLCCLLCSFNKTDICEQILAALNFMLIVKASRSHQLYPMTLFCIMHNVVRAKEPAVRACVRACVRALQVPQFKYIACSTTICCDRPQQFEWF
jgi:hypothetical protein